MDPAFALLNPLSNFGRFFAALDLALAVAEARYGFPGKALDARERLIKIAAGPEPGAGSTSFVNVPDIAGKVQHYVNHIYEPGRYSLPDNVLFAERGY
jgi:hypothetical protein